MWRKSGCFTTDFAAELAALGSKREIVASQSWDADQAKQRVTAEAAFGSSASALAAVVNSVTSSVQALHADHDTYSVVFSKISSAGTDHDHRTVQIGTSVLLNPNLTEGERAAGLVGIALHETGHINHSQPYGKAVRDHWKGSPLLPKAYSLHNVGDDNRIEALQLEEFPALTAALECTAYLMFQQVVDQLEEQGKVAPFQPDMKSAKGRENALKMGTRYPSTVDWTGHDESLAFIRGWAESMSAAHTPKEHVSLIEEALEWIADLPEAEEEPQPTEGGDEGEESDEPPTEGGEKGEPKEGNPGDAEGDDEDGDGGDAEGDDEESGADGDTEGDTEGEGEGEGEDADSEPTDDGEAGEGEGEESNDTDTEGEPNESESEGGSETDAEGDDDDSEGNDLDMPKGDAKGDTDGDAESDNPTDADSPTEGETAQSGDVGSDEVTDGDLELTNEIPEIPDEITDAAHDSENDSLADDLTEAHARGKRDVKRMRRYPGATGGTVIVQEVTLKELPKVEDKWLDEMSLGNSVTEDENNVQQAALRGQQLDDYGEFSYDWRTEDRPTAHAALAAVIMSARKGAGAPETHQRSGRVDRSRLSRVATGDSRVFVKNTNPAPQKVRVHIVIDASGSMGGGNGFDRRSNAAQVGRDLAGALDRLPWATARVYGFAEDDINFVARIWQSGEKRDRIDDYLRMPSGGTPLGYCVAYVADDLLDEKMPNEKGVVIVISDGNGSYSGGNQHTKGVVDYYRKQGLRVVSVAMASLGEAQRQMFGSDAIEYEPDMRKFARNLAKVIGSSL